MLLKPFIAHQVLLGGKKSKPQTKNKNKNKKKNHKKLPYRIRTRQRWTSDSISQGGLFLRRSLLVWLLWVSVMGSYRCHILPFNSSRKARQILIALFPDLFIYPQLAGIKTPRMINQRNFVRAGLCLKLLKTPGNFCRAVCLCLSRTGSAPCAWWCIWKCFSRHHV